MRYAARRDLSHAPIRDGLRDCGIVVAELGLPVDIAIRRPWWPAGLFLLAECKTQNRKQGHVLDKRRVAQTKFCSDHGVPYFLTLEDALKEIKRVDGVVG